MTLLLLLLLLLVAPVQAAIATALVRDPLAAPVLPVALIAAWAVTRGGTGDHEGCPEIWPAILLPAVVLGAASEERMGWFLLALLPAPALAAVGAARIRPRVTGFGRRLGIATGVAALGAMSYAVVLAVAAGLATDLPASSPSLLATGLGSAGLAAVAMLAFWPLRRRERSLFA
ncbi:MAG: hypothetical protein M0R73_12370 [Dehalococcoidia bacterium]|nr:hypothetical protein [Dehalococcoidia bacterium]